MSATTFYRGPEDLITRICFNPFDGDALLNAVRSRRAAEGAADIEVSDEDIRKFCPLLVAGLAQMRKFVRDYSS
jgi:hypothetical protein